MVAGLRSKGAEYDFSWVEKVSAGLDATCFGVIVAYNTSQQTQELTMPRKLIHSLRALAVTFGVFAASFIVGIPGDIKTAPDATVLQVGVAQPAVMGAAAPQASAVKPTATKQRQRRRHARDEMALPFFSFAHTLRRGNGS
jgi:hypothetical protein